MLPSVTGMSRRPTKVPAAVGKEEWGGGTVRPWRGAVSQWRGAVSSYAQTYGGTCCSERQGSLTD